MVERKLNEPEVHRVIFKAEILPGGYDALSQADWQVWNRARQAVIKSEMPEVGAALPHEYIKVGWCQGAAGIAYDDTPVPARSGASMKMCMTGAINAALPEDVDKTEGLFMLSQRMRQDIYNIVGRTAVWWNDTKGRRQEDVVAVLQKAAEKGEWQNAIDEQRRLHRRRVIDRARRAQNASKAQ